MDRTINEKTIQYTMLHKFYNESDGQHQTIVAELIETIAQQLIKIKNLEAGCRVWPSAGVRNAAHERIHRLHREQGRETGVMPEHHQNGGSTFIDPNTSSADFSTQSVRSVTRALLAATRVRNVNIFNDPVL